jgi:hypothetical protein
MNLTHLYSPRPAQTPSAARFSAANFRRLAHTALAAGAVLFMAAPGGLDAAEAPSRIVNFSARAAAGTGDQTVILGFAVKGNADGLLVRALGPTLQPFGVANAATDPRLTVFSGNRVQLTNDNWTLAAVAPATGAHPLLAGSKDAAILSPFAYGQYTAHVTTPAGDNGVVLAELFDAQTYTSAPLANVSARAQTGKGESTFISGFTIDGSAKKRVLLRATGPSLSAFGVTGPVSDPKLSIYARDTTTPFAVNDNWDGSPILRTAMEQSGAFPLTTTSKDAALLLDLAPGSYTAHVTGADGGDGVALFELYDDPVSVWPILTTSNVTYQHGDSLKFDANGTYYHADGSRTVVTNGWLRLDIADEELINPNNNVRVFSLYETLMYEGFYVSATGESIPVRSVMVPAVRLFRQDEFGTPKYQGDRLAEAVDANGAPVYYTYWLVSPEDYVQYQMPLAPGKVQDTTYDRRTLDGLHRVQGHAVSNVVGMETITTPMGRFETYRMTFHETSVASVDFGRVISTRNQYIHPAIGIVRFDFGSATPGDSGFVVQNLCETNVPFDGAPVHALTSPPSTAPSPASPRFVYTRSGYYTGNDGTVEEISGSLTVDLLNEGVTNPLTNQPVMTLLEKRVTVIEATTLAGVSTTTTQREDFRRYLSPTATGMVLVGETAATGEPLWYSTPYVPLANLNTVGDTNTQTIATTRWVSGQATPGVTYDRTMTVASLARTATAMGTFECFRIVATESNGRRVDEYTYPTLGVVRYRHAAPAGKNGHMDLTLSWTNLPFN